MSCNQHEQDASSKHHWTGLANFASWDFQANSHFWNEFPMPRCMCFLHIVMRQPNRLEKALASCLKAKNQKKKKAANLLELHKPKDAKVKPFHTCRKHLETTTSTNLSSTNLPMAVAVSPHFYHRIFSTPRRFHPPGHPRIVGLCPWMKTGTTCRRWHLQEFSQEHILADSRCLYKKRLCLSQQPKKQRVSNSISGQQKKKWHFLTIYHLKSGEKKTYTSTHFFKTQTNE